MLTFDLRPHRRVEPLVCWFIKCQNEKTVLEKGRGDEGGDGQKKGKDTTEEKMKERTKDCKREEKIWRRQNQLKKKKRRRWRRSEGGKEEEEEEEQPEARKEVISHHRCGWVTVSCCVQLSLWQSAVSLSLCGQCAIVCASVRLSGSALSPDRTGWLLAASLLPFPRSSFTF